MVLWGIQEFQISNVQMNTKQWNHTEMRCNISRTEFTFCISIIEFIEHSNRSSHCTTRNWHQQPTVAYFRIELGSSMMLLQFFKQNVIATGFAYNLTQFSIFSKFLDRNIKQHLWRVKLRDEGELKLYAGNYFDLFAPHSMWEAHWDWRIFYWIVIRFHCSEFCENSQGRRLLSTLAYVICKWLQARKPAQVRRKTHFRSFCVISWGQMGVSVQAL